MFYEKPQPISFIVMGAQRSGHASVQHALSQHPQLKLIAQEHHGFFAKDQLFERGNPPSSLYNGLCAASNAEQICGEVSSSYLHHPSAIARIHRYNPTIKLIVILRNPADRAYSHWQDVLCRGQKGKTLATSTHEDIFSVGYSSKYQSTHDSEYLSESRYSKQITHLRQYFDPHQLLFIKSEDLRDDTEVMLYQMFQFLNVPYLDVDTSAQNLGNYQHSMSAESYNTIIKTVQSDIKETEHLLGWNCEDWKQLKPVPQKHATSL